MTREDIQSAVLRHLARIAPEADLGALDPEQSYADQFDFDSVDCLNLVLAVEKELGVRIPESDYPEMASLGSAVRYLWKVSKAGPPPKRPRKG